jgi:hypothetical protein
MKNVGVIGGEDALGEPNEGRYSTDACTVYDE